MVQEMKDTMPIDDMAVSGKVKRTAQEIRSLLDGLTYEEAMLALQIAGENLPAYAILRFYR